MKIERVAERSAVWAARIGGGLILASAVLISAEVAVRNLGISLTLHSFELTNFAFAAAVAFGFAYTTVRRAHIRIDVLYGHLPRPVRAILDVISTLALAGLAFGMAWHAWRVVRRSAELGARPNSTLDIPMAAPQGLWATGLSFFALVAGIVALATIVRLVTGRLAEINRTVGLDTNPEARE